MHQLYFYLNQTKSIIIISHTYNKIMNLQFSNMKKKDTDVSRNISNLDFIYTTSHINRLYQSNLQQQKNPHQNKVLSTHKNKKKTQN